MKLAWPGSKKQKRNWGLDLNKLQNLTFLPNGRDVEIEGCSIKVADEKKYLRDDVYDRTDAYTEPTPDVYGDFSIPITPEQQKLPISFGDYTAKIHRSKLVLQRPEYRWDPIKTVSVYNEYYARKDPTNEFEPIALIKERIDLPFEKFREVYPAVGHLAVKSGLRLPDDLKSVLKDKEVLQGLDDRGNNPASLTSEQAIKTA